MYWHPCRNCAVEAKTCSIRNDMAKTISGLRVTSIKFNCEGRKKMFRTGQRAQLSWSVAGEYKPIEDVEIYEKYKFNCTVLAESKNRPRFLVRVDAEGHGHDLSPKDVFRNENLVLYVKPKDLEDLQEPDREFCEACFAYDGKEAENMCVGWRGEYDPLFMLSDSYHPNGCLLKFSELKL